ncbi:hypothetical protein AFLA_005481 [Aspergillus flavus NRRL3357]|nr:hypothetical protein AFLA_005481 [Aspergillus flavus NRRL3357]
MFMIKLWPSDVKRTQISEHTAFQQLKVAGHKKSRVLAVSGPIESGLSFRARPTVHHILMSIPASIGHFCLGSFTARSSLSPPLLFGRN